MSLLVGFVLRAVDVDGRQLALAAAKGDYSLASPVTSAV